VNDNHAPGTSVGMQIFTSALTYGAAGSAVNFADPFWAAAQSWTVLTGASASGTFALGTATNDFTGKGASNYGTFAVQQTATDITLRAVWSTALGGWSTTGITEDILLDDGTVQTVKAKVLTAPDTKKFLRLEATRP